MAKMRAIMGLVGGALLILSSFAHSLLGWKVMSLQLQTTQVPPELLNGLRMGWHFGGAVMLALGIVMIWLFNKRLRGEAISTFPAVVIAIAYLSFGIWALVVSDFDPFGLVFIIPGVLLLTASRRTRTVQ